jgi:hypothetical protein
MMLSNQELGYISAVLQVAAQAKAVDAEQLKNDLVNEAIDMLNKSTSQIVEAQVVQFPRVVE